VSRSERSSVIQREAALRRRAGEQHLEIVKDRSAGAQAFVAGGYMVVDPVRGRPVAGAHPVPFMLSLRQAEAEIAARLLKFAQAASSDPLISAAFEAQVLSERMQFTSDDAARRLARFVYENAVTLLIDKGFSAAQITRLMAGRLEASRKLHPDDLSILRGIEDVDPANSEVEHLVEAAFLSLVLATTEVRSHVVFHAGVMLWSHIEAVWKARGATRKEISETLAGIARGVVADGEKDSKSHLQGRGALRPERPNPFRSARAAVQGFDRRYPRLGLLARLVDFCTAGRDRRSGAFWNG
jgi:hypothetical protein